MKVLVTGATGFIGNYVVKELLTHKHEVMASSVNKDKASAMEWFNAVSYIPLILNHLIALLIIIVFLIDLIY